MSGFYSTPSQYEQIVNNIRAADKARADAEYDRIIATGGSPGTKSAYLARIAADAAYTSILAESDATYDDRAAAILSQEGK